MTALAEFGLADRTDLAEADAAGCTAAVLDAHGIRALDAAEWDRLSGNALVENPYYARQYVMAGLEALAGEHTLSMVAVRLGAAGRLVGLFPFRAARLLGVPLGCATGALNLYQISSTPLIDRDHAHAALDRFFDCCGAAGVPARWIFPHVDLSAAFAGLCRDMAAPRRLAATATGAYRRPRLTRIADGFNHHVAAVIGKKRARSIERSLRRLSDLGAVTFEHTSDPERVRARLEAYLAMEHEGWKGRRGTSLLSERQHARFARLAYGGGAAAEGLASVDSLLLDGEPIAISINIQSGRTAFTPKCTFDERYRKYGPGVVLEYLVIKRFHEERWCDAMDASTMTDEHPVFGLWNETRPIGTLIVGPEGWRTAMLVRAVEGWHRAKRQLKRLLLRLRLGVARQARD